MYATQIMLVFLSLMAGLLIHAEVAATRPQEPSTIRSRALQEQAHILVGPNVLVSWQREGRFAELLLAADPTNPRNLLGTGIFSRSSHPEGGAETRAYYSRDGGYSWNPIIFPEVAANGGGADPQVAYGRTGTGYFVTLISSVKSPPPRKCMLFYRSEDGGVTWGKPTDPDRFSVQEKNCDHPQIAVDQTAGRFAGSVYITVDYPFKNHGMGDAHIGLFRSTDDGRTWIGPVDVANNHSHMDRRYHNENPVLFTDGELFVPFIEAAIDRAKNPLDPENLRYRFATSKDGGATFTAPQKFTLQGGGEIAGLPFTRFPFLGNSLPMFAIDNSDGPFRDRIYVAWLEQTDDPPVRGRYAFDWYYPDAVRKSVYEAFKDKAGSTRLFMSYSSDRGRTWAKPKMVASIPGVGDQWNQSIAVNNQDTVALSWYDTRDTPAGYDGVLVHRYLAASIDGGETFLPAVRVSSAPTDPSVALRNLIGADVKDVDGTSINLMDGGGGKINGGEYLGLATDTDGTFHPFWTDGRTGTYQIWTARVRVEPAVGKREDQEAKPPLVQADVSDRVEAVLEPLLESSQAGTVELPIRLRNKSGQPIYRPITVEVTNFNVNGALLNAGNGKAGVGATFDYSRALGDFESLPPSAISEGVVWRFRMPSHRGDRKLKFKVTAMVERPKVEKSK